MPRLLASRDSIGDIAEEFLDRLEVAAMSLADRVLGLGAENDDLDILLAAILPLQLEATLERVAPLRLREDLDWTLKPTGPAIVDENEITHWSAIITLSRKS